MVTTFAGAAGSPPSLGSPARRAKVGADEQDRTADLVLTKDALCQLSYIGHKPGIRCQDSRNRGIRPDTLPALIPESRHLIPPILERETGIEPATNSLEGCDSTTELLPPCSPQLTLFSTAYGHQCQRFESSMARQPTLTRVSQAKVGGEGRVRTSVATRAADLQSAAIDRSATSPNSLSLLRRQDSGIRTQTLNPDS